MLPQFAQASLRTDKSPLRQRYGSVPRLRKSIRRRRIQKIAVEKSSSPKVEGFSSRSIHACPGCGIIRAILAGGGLAWLTIIWLARAVLA